MGGAMIGLAIRTTPTIVSDVESGSSWWSKFQIDLCSSDVLPMTCVGADVEVLCGLGGVVVDVVGGEEEVVVGCWCYGGEGLSCCCGGVGLAAACVG
ncbi:hypothetical protein A2U01_0009605 [Trifolium medium]|uniref:Uncharacterized protein n=1 Tax=Trifolium medium TaxID=97028 RepID=A0A392MR12_9FABA|nr:hypothetical protein [Trifolium medium]